MKLSLPPSSRPLFSALGSSIRKLIERLKVTPIIDRARRAWSRLTSRETLAELRASLRFDLRNPTLQTKLLAGFVGVGIIFILAALIAIITQNRLVRSGDQVNRSHAVVEQGDLLQMGLLNMEAGYQSFLLTGQEASLTAYRAGREQYHSALDRLVIIQAGNRAQLDRLKDIRDEAETWDRDWLAPGIALRHKIDAGQGDLQDAVRFEAQSQAKLHMDRIQALLAEVTQVESAQLEAATQANASAAKLAARVLIGGALFALALGIAIALVFARSVTRPLEALAADAQRLAEGGLDVAAHAGAKAATVARRDEVGQMARGLIAINGYINEMTGVAERIAHGDLTVEVQPRSELDDLGLALQRMIASLNGLVGQTLDNAAELNDASSELADAAQRASGATGEMTSTLEQISMGAAQQTASVDSAGETVGLMNQAIETVARGVKEQEAAVRRATAVTGRISAAVERVSQNAAQSAMAAAGATRAAENGSGTVRSATITMQAIQARVGKSSEKVQEMSRLSEMIGSILEAIQDIASQTNMLALNAAIEAAHAGQYGVGFAVVAEEVRKLSERSSNSAKEIARLIQAIQNTAGEAVTAMEASTREVESGVQQVDASIQALQEIQTAAETVGREVEEISTAAGQAAAAAGELGQAMEAVAQVTKANAAAANQMTSGALQVEFEIESMTNINAENAAAVDGVGAGIDAIRSQVEEVSRAAGALAGLARTLLEGVSAFHIADGSESSAAGGEPMSPPRRLTFLGPDRRAGLADRIERGIEPQN